MSVIQATGPAGPANSAPARPPIWLFAATGILALTCLVLAVAETTLWAHYLIGGGDFLSLFGLGFILLAGLHLFRQRRLMGSLPLTIPWLVYPIISQGDQIIDRLSINWMRAICQVLLAALFAAPVVVVVQAVQFAIGPNPRATAGHLGRLDWIPGLKSFAAGRTREGKGILAAMLFAAEIWVAYRFLGTLTVLTVNVMLVLALAYAAVGVPRFGLIFARGQAGVEKLALVLLLAGVGVSFGLYEGFKHRPGTYQGSPSAFMDPAQRNQGYPLERVAVPARSAQAPANPEAARTALVAYGRALEGLLAGYHVLDRNYTYDFHNHLFLKSTPLVANYRAVGLSRVNEARTLRAQADAAGLAARATLQADDPLAALLDDLREYTAYLFERAPTLEQLSGECERTEAGLQHAAHLYEGESKALGTGLGAILRKHEVVLQASVTQPVTGGFVSIGKSVYEAYAHRVVGF